MKKSDVLKFAKSIVDIESKALTKGIESIDDSFYKACKLILKMPKHAKVIVIGMGKSGHIGNKISATLASTGTPAFSIHPGEAGHGDLGMISSEDIIIAISQSGSSSELIQLLPYVKRKKIKLISMTGQPDSELGSSSDYIIKTSVTKEACPLNLAPTASTTLTLALGDALAITLHKNRGFTAENFAETHPSGLLGRRLLINVGSVMTSLKDSPIVKKEHTIKDVLFTIAKGRMGIVIICSSKKPIGVFTDGDLRRALDKNIDINEVKINQIMTKRFTCISEENLAIDALNIMNKKNITALPVIDKTNNLVGSISISQILNAGLS